MLPFDVDTCLRLSDIYGIARDRGLTERMADLLIHYLKEGQMWGAVVDHKTMPHPICFGSCIFLSKDLAKEVMAGKHPFLLADLCDNPALRAEVLQFTQVEKEAKAKRLNFYGALFTFPKTTNPGLFKEALDRQLQESFVKYMRAFNLALHMKNTYGRHKVFKGIRVVAYRMGFGSDLQSSYKELRRQGNAEVLRHNPVLFAYTREQAENSIGGKPVTQVMGIPENVLDLPRSAREIIRLDLEDRGDIDMQAALQKDNRYFEDNSWGYVARKMDTATASFLRISDENTEIRACVREYVRHNPQELGVLPPLTPLEKKEWDEHVLQEGRYAPRRARPKEA